MKYLVRRAYKQIVEANGETAALANFKPALNEWDTFGAKVYWSQVEEVIEKPVEEPHP